MADFLLGIRSTVLHGMVLCCLHAALFHSVLVLSLDIVPLLAEHDFEVGQIFDGN